MRSRRFDERPPCDPRLQPLTRRKLSAFPPKSAPARGSAQFSIIRHDDYHRHHDRGPLRSAAALVRESGDHHPPRAAALTTTALSRRSTPRETHRRRGDVACRGDAPAAARAPRQAQPRAQPRACRRWSSSSSRRSPRASTGRARRRRPTRRRRARGSGGRRAAARPVRRRRRPRRRAAAATGPSRVTCAELPGRAALQAGGAAAGGKTSDGPAKPTASRRRGERLVLREGDVRGQSCELSELCASARCSCSTGRRRSPSTTATTAKCSSAPSTARSSHATRRSCA